ncbi:MAG: hypothetical protein N838_28845 [Thiohalocapsa sp. PB-PSB1]|nr:MAG: hypothetical protein N838_28845 [Thiohalocapsa sp. PB-PSB1]
MCQLRGSVLIRLREVAFLLNAVKYVQGIQFYLSDAISFYRMQMPLTFSQFAVFDSSAPINLF